MKYIYIMLTSLLALNSFGALSPWSRTEEGRFYKLTQNLNLIENKVKINQGIQLRLIEKTDLNMIKVQLQKFRILNCKDKNQETELELVSIKQKNSSNKISVGVNISKGCILEVFVEDKDKKELSFLK